MIKYNDYLGYPISQEMVQIINNLKKRDWLISNFKKTTDLYTPIPYIYNNLSENIHYTFILDRNILSYILDGGNSSNFSNSRDAIGLVAFCQLSKINFDISLAIHERINEKIDLEKAYNEIEHFFQIDDSNTIELENYAVGKIDSFSENPKDSNLKKQQIKEWYEKYSTITEWHSMYLIILKITYTFSKKNKYHEGFFEVIDWMQNHFRYSLVGIIFSLYIFRNEKIKNIMKYKPSHDTDQRKSDIVNMTWDLFIMNNYFRKLQNKNKNNEYLFVSNDKALNKILRTAIDVQLTGSISTMKKHIEDKDFCMVDYLIENYHTENKNRAFNTGFKNRNYRKKLIEELENELF